MTHGTIDLSPSGLPSGDRLWSVLRRTKLGPMLFASRLRLRGRVPPPAWRRAFRQDYLRSLVSHHHYRASTLRVLDAASSAGIPAIVLRGTRLAETLYDDPALRPYTDIDVLVPRARLEEVKSLARDLGFLPPPGSFPDSFYERNHLHLRYRCPATGIPLEIHWAVDHPFSLHRIAYGALFRNARPVRLDGRTTLRPSAEDELLLLALHLVKHAPSLRCLPRDELAARCVDRGLLLWMIDLHRLLGSRNGGWDWEAVIRKACAWEIAGPVGAALSAVASVLGTPVPADPLRDLNRAGPPGVVERGVARLAGGRGPFSTGFRALSGRVSRSPAFFGLERLAGVADYLLPPVSWAARHAPLPRLPLAIRRAAHALRSGVELGRLGGTLMRLVTFRAAARTLGHRPPLGETRRSPARG